MLELRDVRSADDVAKAIVAAHIAPAAAVGWVSAAKGRWEVSLGGATGFFDLASLTKPMTAIAIARSGIDRSTKLAALVPEAKGTLAGDAPIELLLAHRAGLEAHVKLYAPLLEAQTIDFGSALADAASSIRSDVRSLPAEPVYSDLGYFLAGVALQRHVGVADAGEAIERLVVAPLDVARELGTARSLRRFDDDFMKRVEPTEDVPWRGGVIRGEVHDENAFGLGGDGGCGHAGMFGTLGATLAFARAAYEAIVLREGPLACGNLDWLVAERPGGTLRAGFDGKSQDGSSAGDHAGPRTFGHLGFTGTSVWIDPDAKTAVSVLTNRVHPTRDNVAIRAARPLVHDALWALATRG